ncbi:MULTISPECIES: GntR family transcriptional regulator [Bacillaceae]|uniref:GntR family transcriptional regulator n=1 Tax=Peribacillus huizhouensis TaxID=1501239 RepID=A0ABR6CN03_9BACI|nr:MULTISPECIES: GntR family transcriptional regulator [Bacillaceae]MBA9026393.1 GntR family transcriptional regulator [Peribacillus huizhouensis]
MAKKLRYIQVKEEIERSIKNKELLPGQKLNSEPMLAKKFNVSRSTLREAIKMLQKEGLLISKNGVGTYVNNKLNHIENPLNKLQSTGQMIRNVGYEAGETDIKIYQMNPEEEWKIKLRLEETEQVTILERTRTADGNKVAFYYNIFPQNMIGDLFNDGFSGAIFDVLEKEANVKITSAITEIYAVDPSIEMDQKAIELLGNKIILLKQLHFDDANQPIFYSLDYINTSIFKLTIKRD